MKNNRHFDSISYTVIALLIFFLIFPVSVPAKEKMNSVKSIKATVQKNSISRSFPDLVLEKIELDKECCLILKIRNEGSASIPEEKFKDCVVKVWVGGNQENFYLGTTSKRGKPPVDPRGILLKAGGEISYNTGIRVLEETKATVNVDSENAIMETNEANNRSGTVALKPDCPKPVAPASGKTRVFSSPKPGQLGQTLQRKKIKIPEAATRAIPRISDAFDLIQPAGSLIVLQGQNFGNSPEARSVRLVRSNSSGDPVMNFFLSVRSWTDDEIIADIPEALIHPSNPSERGTHLNERTGRFSVGLYKRNETRWLSNEASVRAGSRRDTDQDGDGYNAVRFLGKDCNDRKPSVNPREGNCPP
jgi:hypothetical protein